MSIISPVNTTLPCHFNTATEILTSVDTSEEQVGPLPTVSSDEVSDLPASSNSCGYH